MDELRDIRDQLADTDEALTRALDILDANPDDRAAQLNVRSLAKRDRVLTAKLDCLLA